MPNRSELITRFPLVESGQRMPKHALQAKEAELLKSLRDDVPVLNHLRASSLATDYEVVEKSLKLVVLLQEAAQIPLPFAAAGTGRRAGTVDAFLEDVADVKRQVSDAEGRILIATSGASSPLDGSADGPQTSSTATIRRRVRRGIAAGGVFVPDVPDARLWAMSLHTHRGRHLVLSGLTPCASNQADEDFTYEHERILTARCRDDKPPPRVLRPAATPSPDVTGLSTPII